MHLVDGRSLLHIWLKTRSSGKELSEPIYLIQCVFSFGMSDLKENVRKQQQTIDPACSSDLNPDKKAGPFLKLFFFNAKYTDIPSVLLCSVRDGNVNIYKSPPRHDPNESVFAIVKAWFKPDLFMVDQRAFT